MTKSLAVSVLPLILERPDIIFGLSISFSTASFSIVKVVVTSAPPLILPVPVTSPSKSNVLAVVHVAAEVAESAFPSKAPVILATRVPIV